MLQETTEDDIKSSLVKLFETDAETNETKYSADEEFALNYFLKHVKQENNRRYIVSHLFKQKNFPIKNNTKS